MAPMMNSQVVIVAVIALVTRMVNCDLVPDGTDPNSTTLDLTSTGITAIDAFPDFALCSKVILANNLLEVFPDVTSLADTLTWLDLDDNKILSVDAGRLGALALLDRLYLKNNLLTTLPTINAPSALTKIFLDGNPLTSLPALGVFGANVLWLEISDTGLTELDPIALSGYTSCILVNMRNNGFTTWPDFTPISGTFVQADVRGNPIAGITLAEILSTPKFRTVGLSRSPLMTLPNLCHTPVTGSHWVGGWDLPLTCDCHLRWLKVALAAGKVKLWYGTPVCAAPPSVAGVNLEDVPLTDFTCKGGAGKEAINPYADNMAYMYHHIYMYMLQ